MARLLVALLVAPSCALLWATRPARARTRDGMYRFETEHYDVETDVSAEFAHVVARHMEEILREYARRFRDYGRTSRKFDVVVYERRADFEEAVPPAVKGATGIFISRERLLVTHADGRTPEEVLRTLYHEGFHQYMHEVLSPNPPAWINEGLAEYFSEATWNGDQFEVGIVPTMRLHIVQKAIEEGSYVPLGTLFDMDAVRWNQTMATDVRRANLYYSEAWSVVQFLIHAENGRYAHRINRFLRMLSEGADQQEAFEDSFGTNLARFEELWARYVISLRPSPKFQCRDGMESLLLLAKLLYEDPAEMSDVGNLRHRVLNQRRYRWEIRRPTGEVIRSSQREKVAALFRCPYDRTDTGISYVLLHNVRRGGLPVLACNRHPGVVILSYYERAPDGELKVAVEEQVRGTMKPHLRRSLAASYR